MPCSQDWPLIVKCIDNDLQLVVGWDDSEYITEIHVHEGRDIEGLVAALDDLGRTLGLHRDKVGVPLAERVVDFPENGFERPVPAVAENTLSGLKAQPRMRGMVSRRIGPPSTVMPAAVMAFSIWLRNSILLPSPRSRR